MFVSFDQVLRAIRGGRRSQDARNASHLSLNFSPADIVPLAHTPLAKGLATGIYTASNPTGGKTGLPKYNFQDLLPLTPVHTALVEVRFRSWMHWG